MRKALHDENEEFFIFREGKFSRFRVNDIDWLLEAANDAPIIEHREKQGFTLLVKNGVPALEISPEENFCYWVNRFMSKLLYEGVTEELVGELNSLLSEIRYIHILMISKGGEPYWQRNIGDMNKTSTPVEAAAFAFSHQLAIGGLKDLKCCELSDCKKFFVGRPNSKWCSKSCGSKYRVRSKRKRDL